MKRSVYRTIIVTIVGSLLGSPLPCLCAPSEWVRWDVSSGGNGHWYKAVPGFSGLTWTLADERAQEEGGHLATITSAAENAFVFSLVAGDPQYWTYGNWSGPALGGFQQEGAPEPAGGWDWVTGEPWTYSNWYPGQPDNWPNGPWHEDRLHFIFGSDKWNDIGKDDFNIGGYVIERNTTVPVVSTSLASDVTKKSATLNGCITDDGGEACQYRFRYREERGNYLPYTSWAGSVATGESFSEAISDLKPNATYYFNAQAKNSAGESDWGNEQSFVARGIDFKIDQAGMISPHELGIAIKVKYPDYGYETTRKVKFSATINGNDVETVIDITPCTQRGEVWEPGLIPTTPLKIDLADPDGDPETKDDVPRFAENQTFDLTGVAYCDEGGPAPQEDVKGVKIPLPVVVLGGWSEVFPNPGDLIPYVGAYGEFTGFLTRNGYNSEDTWRYFDVPAYRTLWDPSDFQYTDPLRASDIMIEFELDGFLLAVVQQHNYAIKADLIGHSFGGLVARYYSSVRPENVNKVITVGTPHLGLTDFYKQALSMSREQLGKKLPAWSILRWTVPTYPCTYLKEKNTFPPLDPSSICPLFANTLTAPTSGKGYYSIFGSGRPTDESLLLAKRGDWYKVERVLNPRPDGDDYVLATSASAFGTPCDPIPVGGVLPHVRLLRYGTVQNQILRLLQGD